MQRAALTETQIEFLELSRKLHGAARKTLGTVAACAVWIEFAPNILSQSGNPVDEFPRSKFDSWRLTNGECLAKDSIRVENEPDAPTSSS